MHNLISLVDCPSVIKILHLYNYHIHTSSGNAFE